MDNWKYEQLSLALTNGWAQVQAFAAAAKKRLVKVDNSDKQLWLGLSCALPKLGFWKRVFFSLKRAFRILIKSR